MPDARRYVGLERYVLHELDTCDGRNGMMVIANEGIKPPGIAGKWLVPSANDDTGSDGPLAFETVGN